MNNVFFAERKRDVDNPVKYYGYEFISTDYYKCWLIVKVDDNGNDITYSSGRGNLDDVWDDRGVLEYGSYNDAVGPYVRR